MKKSYTTPRAVYVNFDYEEQVVARSVPKCVPSQFIMNAQNDTCVLMIKMTRMTYDGECTFYNDAIE